MLVLAYLYDLSVLDVYVFPRHCLYERPPPRCRVRCQARNVGRRCRCLQCGLWAIYALPMVTPGKLQPLVTNAVGFGLELFYVLLFVRFSIKTERLWMIFYLAIVLFGISAVTAGALVLVPRLGAGSEGVPCWPDDCASKQTNILGLTCTVQLRC